MWECCCICYFVFVCLFVCLFNLSLEAVITGILPFKFLFVSFGNVVYHLLAQKSDSNCDAVRACDAKNGRNLTGFHNYGIRFCKACQAKWIDSLNFFSLTRLAVWLVFSFSWLYQLNFPISKHALWLWLNCSSLRTMDLKMQMSMTYVESKNYGLKAWLQGFILIAKIYQLNCFCVCVLFQCVFRYI